MVHLFTGWILVVDTSVKRSDSTGMPYSEPYFIKSSHDELDMGKIELVDRAVWELLEVQEIEFRAIEFTNKPGFLPQVSRAGVYCRPAIWQRNGLPKV